MKPDRSASAVLRFAAALLVTAGFTSNVAAQDADPAPQERMRAQLQERFTAADTNADGRLSRDEAKGGMPRVYRNFDAIDAEKTGAVTLEQIAAFAAKRGGRL